MVNVTDGSNVHVRLVALEFLLRHFALCSSVEVFQIALPRDLPTNPSLPLPGLSGRFAGRLSDHFLRDRSRRLGIMRKMHRKRGAPLRAAAQIRGVAEHLREWYFHANHVAARTVFRALNRRTPRIQVSEHLR